MKKHLQKLLFMALMLITTVHLSFGQKGIAVPELSGLEADFVSWLNNTHEALGGSLAISKDGKLVYARSFGKADIAGAEDAQPYHLYRIASMSKSITSIMLMKLMQDGLVSMDDKVFGSNGILNDAYYSGITIPDTAALYSITVRNLLEHTSGIEPGAPSILEITAKFGEANPGKIQTLVKYMMTKPLKYAPGTVGDYNNEGYVILAAVIEKISGVSLNDYLVSILRPMGMYYSVGYGNSQILLPYIKVQRYIGQT